MRPIRQNHKWRRNESIMPREFIVSSQSIVFSDRKSISCENTTTSLTQTIKICFTCFIIIVNFNFVKFAISLLRNKLKSPIPTVRRLFCVISFFHYPKAYLTVFSTLKFFKTQTFKFRTSVFLFQYHSLPANPFSLI